MLQYELPEGIGDEALSKLDTFGRRNDKLEHLGNSSAHGTGACAKKGPLKGPLKGSKGGHSLTEKPPWMKGELNMVNASKVLNAFGYGQSAEAWEKEWYTNQEQLKRLYGQQYKVTTVFCIFESEHGQRKCLEALTIGLLPAMMDLHWGDAEALFRGSNELFVTEAPSPRDVLWDNLGRHNAFERAGEEMHMRRCTHSHSTSLLRAHHSSPTPSLFLSLHTLFHTHHTHSLSLTLSLSLSRAPPPLGRSTDRLLALPGCDESAVWPPHFERGLGFER
jgi:hypothetical protein